MQTTVKLALVGIGGLALAGCGPAEGDVEHAAEHGAESGSAVLSSQGDVLSVGAAGDEVRAVHRYLRDVGYLPNEGLRRLYPAWRPPVSAAPARDDVFDEHTAEAMRALQRQFGLSESGMVDAESRELMAQKRCGVPDAPELDESNKYDLSGLDWSSEQLTWRLMNTNGQCDINSLGGKCITQAQAESMLTNAFAAWQGPSRHTFAKTTGAATIEVRFSAQYPDGTGWGSRLAAGFKPKDGSDLYINGNELFSIANTPPVNLTHLPTVVLHELGHTLGLDHSSVNGDRQAVMLPVLGPGVVRRLTPDDNVAALAMGLSWQRFDSTSYDIDVDSGPTWQNIFVVADPPLPGGYTVWMRENGAWTILGDQGAVRVASNGGNPWMIQDSGEIYSWDWSFSGWTRRPGCAKDIAVGGDNSVWVLGCTRGNDGYRAFKWNGASWNIDPNQQGGYAITVGPINDGGQNVPWMVTETGYPIRRDTADITGGSWFSLPLEVGGSLVLGTDIAAGSGGAVWMIGKTARSGGFPVYAWNEQPASNTGNPAPLERSRWRSVAGGAIRISVDHDGYPYLVNDAKGAYAVK